jgi:glycosyltransferase involved in cell wall biosynthesis
LREVDELREVVVVDDGSTDDTYEDILIAAERDSRLRCLRLPVNRGKGAALFAGVRTVQADLLLLLDADLHGLTPEHVHDLIAPVSAGRADMSLGLFRNGRVNTDFSHWATPWLTGQRCLRADLFDSLSEQNASGYGIEMALTLAAARHGWRCKHVALRGVWHPSSEFRRGFLSGVWVRSKMYGEIARTWYRERGWELIWPRMTDRLPAAGERLKR